MRQRDDLGGQALQHPSLRFSGSSNHLIHAFLAVASLGNLCPPKLLHLGTQHSVPRLFLVRLSMPPTATHQQDNSYGRSAIWRVSKFVIPFRQNWYSNRWKMEPPQQLLNIWTNRLLDAHSTGYLYQLKRQRHGRTWEPCRRRWWNEAPYRSWDTHQKWCPEKVTVIRWIKSHVMVNLCNCWKRRKLFWPFI